MRPGQCDFLHDLAADARDLAFQVAHAGFACVVTHDALHRRFRHFQFADLQPVRLQLLRQQVAHRDVDLFILGVAGDADHFHAVQQWTWDVQRIRRRHEHHARQVVIDLEVMVVERRILFGIEHFEESR